MDSRQGVALNLFVKRLTSRSILNKDEVSVLLGLKGHLKDYSAHTDFVEIGQRVDCSSLVVDGVVARFGETKDGVRQICCFYIPGDMADLPSVVSPKAGWAIGALSNSVVLRIPHADFRRVAATYPGIAEAFWRDCVADGSIFSEWVVNVGRRDAQARVAHLLCETAIRREYAGQGDRTSFPLAITQSDLANATGMTSVHVNRTLRQLRLQSIVGFRAGLSRFMIGTGWSRWVTSTTPSCCWTARRRGSQRRPEGHPFRALSGW